MWHFVLELPVVVVAGPLPDPVHEKQSNIYNSTMFFFSNMHCIIFFLLITDFLQYFSIDILPSSAVVVWLLEIC